MSIILIKLTVYIMLNENEIAEGGVMTTRAQQLRAPLTQAINFPDRFIE